MKRWAPVAVKVLAAGVISAAAGTGMALWLGPRARAGVGDWIMAAAFALFTLATAGIYGGELRRVNPRRSVRPIDRSGLPPQDTPPDPEQLEKRPPRLRGMIPAIVAFIIVLAIGLVVRLV